MSKNLVGLLISAVIVAAAPFVGLGATVVFLSGAFGATASADPSEKARVLAQGISLSMNGTAIGIVVSCLALVPTIIFAVRLARESQRERARAQQAFAQSHEPAQTK